MLFNTPATLQILKTVNTVFNQSGLKRIRSEGGWDARFNGLPGANGTYSTVAAPLGVDHDDTTMSGNWQTWLTDYFDMNTTNLDKIKIVAAFVGERIVSAITDNSNCLQVEFFAVPTPSGSGGDYIDAMSVDVTNHAKGAPFYTRVILIHTNTRDQLKKGKRP